MSEPFTCIKSFKPKSVWQINSSDTAGPVVSLYPVSCLSFLSLPRSLQSISHLKCPEIFNQMSINRQIDFISSAALLQSWWMNLTFLSSPWWYCLICCSILFWGDLRGCLTVCVASGCPFRILQNKKQNLFSRPHGTKCIFFKGQI